MTATTAALGSELDRPYEGLPPTATADFARDGFIHLSGVLSPETIAEYEPVVTGEVIRLNTQHLPLAERDTYGKAFLQVTNLWEHNAKVKELVYSRRLAGIAASLLGVHAVRLYHDQALYKEPGGGITPWHADQYYWPLSSDRVCTIWLPLQETPYEMGPLAFARGSHNFSIGRDLAISDESEAKLSELVAAQSFEHVEEPFALGDASFHRGWTFHHAGPNHSTVPRRVMTVIYMDADIRVTEPVNDNQVADRGWMPGTEIGQVPDTARNPLLYDGLRSG
ncbi:phytanoyl-CoA dioxygenase family protein [Actinopolymorpha singaporensis]|uniref:Ectoine hydroxylase-related dioxygenase, phytanoyl-CoA dioxygenase (PhyH) family n=1 Tax=Actinopolymorpha singaporensis TaxID=117157 RepID=A0A1H1R8Q1_9ACTN|nr:phytanoyl-CoA dioxygenase family protein [Actinopolymorpha singaporensis]SDS32157.1 Ectoine hydroxylase-related dioxygenase, phytanoyl-CoA dioxygenase (PhyH) family [Actinopolymorpha singaporensis]